MLSTRLRLGLAVLGLAIVGTAARADVATYTLLDVLQQADYTQTPPTETYGGDGFYGMYNVVANSAPSYAHLLGIETTDYSRTIAQVDLSALTGATITGAWLSFDLNNGDGSQDVQLTSWSSTGTLAYSWDSPDNLGQQILLGATGGANSYDVTSLVAPRAGQWLGLHLQGTLGDQYRWTYTSPNGDEANVRLRVEYQPQSGDVPEPGTLALLVGAAIPATLLVIRRRK